jgi:glycosyltransferase involved in cell wall biosynthesis
VSNLRGAVVVVVPCYNEAARLDEGRFLEWVDQTPDVRVLFVDDGSTDDTQARLQAVVAQRPARFDLLTLPQNAGKAEAVRRGMRAALNGPAEVVGYFDADLSTPIAELQHLLDVMADRRPAVVMGARVGLLGADIRRDAWRHYLGRAFASLASLTLRLRVYDTQCGAKLFRRSAVLDAALAQPFHSRWAFDVELIGRLITGGGPGVPPLEASDFVEVPLKAWRDVPGSKLKPALMVGALRDLGQIGIELAARRRAARRRAASR